MFWKCLSKFLILINSPPLPKKITISVLIYKSHGYTKFRGEKYYPAKRECFQSFLISFCKTIHFFFENFSNFFHFKFPNISGNLFCSFPKQFLQLGNNFKVFSLHVRSFPEVILKFSHVSKVF